MDDLKRWGIAHINLTGRKLGRHVLGTAYETEKANDATYFGEPCYYPEKYPSLNPQLHSRSATYIKRNGLLIRKITIKSSRPFQCAYHPLTP